LTQNYGTTLKSGIKISGTRARELGRSRVWKKMTGSGSKRLDWAWIVTEITAFGFKTGRVRRIHSNQRDMTNMQVYFGGYS